MDFLQKLMQITKNVINSLHDNQAKCELITKQLLNCSDYQIQTFTYRRKIEKNDQCSQTDIQDQYQSLKKVMGKNKKTLKKIQRSIVRSQQQENQEQSLQSQHIYDLLDDLDSNQEDQLKKKKILHQKAAKKNSVKQKSVFYQKQMNFSGVNNEYLKSTRSVSEEYEKYLEELFDTF